MTHLIRTLSVLVALFVLASCAGPRSYHYDYRRGYSAQPVGGGLANVPRKAPEAVKRAIAAGNAIAGSPYRYGGGHGRSRDASYDCSGAVSYVLQQAGLLSGSTTSSGFRHYGNRGEGKWITVYARRGHVLLVVAGLRYDTGWHEYPEGPHWTTRSRPLRGYVARHPPGL